MPRRAWASNCRSSSAPAGPVSLKPGGNDHRAWYAEVGRFADDARDDGRRSGDHHQVGFLRQVGELGIGLDAEHAGPGRIDRVDRSAERGVHQVPQHSAADAADLFGGADDGDRFGLEDGIESVAANLAIKGAERFLDGGRCWSIHEQKLGVASIGKSLLSAAFSRHDVRVLILGTNRMPAMCRGALAPTSRALAKVHPILRDNGAIRKQKVTAFKRSFGNAGRPARKRRWHAGAALRCATRAADHAKRLECAELAPALNRCPRPKAGASSAHSKRFASQCIHRSAALPRHRQRVPKSCARYSVGDWPRIFLNTRLKWVSDWNPTSKAISLTRRFGLSRRFLDFSMRTRER